MIPDVVTDAEWAVFDESRCLTVHDDTRGGYRPPVAGWYDQRGYARCLDCPPPGDVQADPISSDNSAAAGELCDVCGAAILALVVAMAGRGDALTIVPV